MIYTYKSPLRKLVCFFKRSRDSWKEKFQNLKIQHRNLERRYEYASNNLASLKKEVFELKSQLPLTDKELKKKNAK